MALSGFCEDRAAGIVAFWVNSLSRIGCFYQFPLGSGASLYL